MVYRWLAAEGQWKVSRFSNSSSVWWCSCPIPRWIRQVTDLLFMFFYYYFGDRFIDCQDIIIRVFGIWNIFFYWLYPYNVCIDLTYCKYCKLKCIFKAWIVMHTLPWITVFRTCNKKVCYCWVSLFSWVWSD